MELHQFTFDKGDCYEGHCRWRWVGRLNISCFTSKTRVEVHLYERAAKIGGRSFTLNKNGFVMNYGSHAVFAYDQSLLRHINEELGLGIEFIP